MACVSGETLSACAGNGSDDSCGDGDFADAVVAGVGEVEVAVGIERQGRGEVELGGGGKRVVTGEAGGGTGDGGDDAGGEVEFADSVVVGVGDIEIVCAVESEALRRVECGGGLQDQCRRRGPMRPSRRWWSCCRRCRLCG